MGKWRIPPSSFNHLPALITSRIKRPKPQVCGHNNKREAQQPCFSQILADSCWRNGGCSPVMVERGRDESAALSQELPSQSCCCVHHRHYHSRGSPMDPPSFSHAHWFTVTKITDWEAAELTAAAPLLSSKTPLKARNDVVCSVLATQLLVCSWWSQFMQTLFLLPLAPDNETKQSVSSSVVPGLFPPAAAHWQGFTGCFWRPQLCASSWNNQVPKTCERTSACLPFFFSTIYPLQLPTTWSKCSASHKLSQESVDVTFSLC